MALIGAECSMHVIGSAELMRYPSLSSVSSSGVLAGRQNSTRGGTSCKILTSAVTMAEAACSEMECDEVPRVR